ncbi:hypothetical protein Val02_57750 [Virgisporangium aliadipatigenens]|uniref:Uncharacterized protein n=1 Tax=Virgisporangium aliadipatigenens TaxID=741659 RepID=A0A8J3YNL6_9ACTN|nr:hypothetical protein [Virgisporangium aliadipatigenens]GIJ48889.1 hypothetical protein Val02_57750 [Virgisporangium aliadipatigenens]
MESSDGVELLLDAGLDRRIVGSAEVEISAGRRRWSRRQVLLLRHSPSPHEIQRALAALRPHTDGLLFVVARAGRALKQAAREDHRIAYAAVDDAVVCVDGELHHADDDRTGQVVQPGRVSWTRLAILRVFALSAAGPLSQSEIARRIGVSHVAVGKQLPLLDDLMKRAATKWRAVDRAACWDRFMAEYPGPRGLTTYWLAADDITAQLGRLHRAAPDPPVISGDLAADFYAPWRRPGRVVAYVTDQPPLEEHGFAAARAVDATVELRTPADPTVPAMAREWPSTGGGAPRRYADPLITAWDLRRSPGGDVESAVEQLRERALREPLWT